MQLIFSRPSEGRKQLCVTIFMKFTKNGFKKSESTQGASLIPDQLCRGSSLLGGSLGLSSLIHPSVSALPLIFPSGVEGGFLPWSFYKVYSVGTASIGSYLCEIEGTLRGSTSLFLLKDTLFIIIINDACDCILFISSCIHKMHACEIEFIKTAFFIYAKKYPMVYFIQGGFIHS